MEYYLSLDPDGEVVVDVDYADEEERKQRLKRNKEINKKMVHKFQNNQKSN